MLNSGTSTNLFASVAALGDFEIIIDGDSSIRKRPVQPLLNALLRLGAEAESIENNGCPPLRIKGPLRGGEAEIARVNHGAVVGSQEVQKKTRRAFPK